MRLAQVRGAAALRWTPAGWLDACMRACRQSPRAAASVPRCASAWRAAAAPAAAGALPSRPGTTRTFWTATTAPAACTSSVRGGARWRCRLPPLLPACLTICPVYLPAGSWKSRIQSLMAPNAGSAAGSRASAPTPAPHAQGRLRAIIHLDMVRVVLRWCCVGASQYTAGSGCAAAPHAFIARAP